jgi:hypothetical protein
MVTGPASIPRALISPTVDQPEAPNEPSWQSISMTPSVRDNLHELPVLLRHVHRALLNYVAEREHVRERGGALLQRVIEDPLFAWLRELSQAMVLLDEILEDEDPSDNALDGVMERLRDMLVRDSESPFRLKYRDALQRSPDVVMAHAALAKRIALPTRKLPLVSLGDQVFAGEAEQAFGAVRAVIPQGRPELQVYIENAGDFAIDLAAVRAVHDGKVVVDTGNLAPEVRAAIAAAHRSEDLSR